MFDAVIAGHICLDIHPDLSGENRESFDRIFLPGRLIEAGPAAFSAGGAVSNTGLALNKLGVSAHLVGKVGDDLFGHALRQILASHGGSLADGLVTDPTGAAPIRSLLITPAWTVSFCTIPGRTNPSKQLTCRLNCWKMPASFISGIPR